MWLQRTALFQQQVILVQCGCSAVCQQVSMYVELQACVPSALGNNLHFFALISHYHCPLQIPTGVSTPVWLQYGCIKTSLQRKMVSTDRLGR